MSDKLTGPFRVVSYYPLKIQDVRGRFVGHQAAEAWCAANGHSWGDLWPDRAWIDWKAEEATAAAEKLKADRDAAGKDDSIPIAAMYFIPAGRWNCETCGETRWRINGETPDAAVSPPLVGGISWPTD